MTVARPVLSTLVLAGAALVACQVYDPSLLTRGAGSAGRGTGGSGADAGTGGSPAGGTGTGGTSISGGPSAGGTATGATGGGGAMSFEAGAGGEGEDPSGGTSGAGGASGGTSGNAGAGGASGGVAGAGGGSGAAGKGGASSGGAGGAGGTPAAGGAGTSAGGAGTGSGGSGTGATNGGAGSGGSAPTEVELTGTATADSSQATTNNMHPAAHGNDNDTATRWCAANGNANHYWQVDLGAVRELTRFEVIWEYPSQATGLPYLYVIGISNDGTAFTTAIDKTTNMEVTPTQSVNFPAATMARHVRITVTGLPASATPTWASFWEASVFGY